MTDPQPYEAPRIESRTDLELPLIGAQSNLDAGVSAFFTHE